MSRIYQLDSQLANLIAAGEVVERPGSVIKELVENSIDAGAKRITVEIKNGGVTYMRVTDDGGGILPEDVRTAFLRHATSKIHTESDLDAIATLGFRGEALAAVSAVAKVDMFTRVKGNTSGVQISIEGGEEKSFGETGCPVGTTVVVRDLFYNVPARAKFLKKDSTEGAYVEAAVTQAAISRPNVAICFIKDGRESFFTTGNGKMFDSIYALCGSDIAAALISISGSFNDISIDGFITQPSVTRANKNMQYFYVNGRPVRSRLLSAALEQAYKGKIMTGRSPACFINISVHLSSIDVNVHPAKLEVKFSREKEVFSALYNVLQTSLEANDSFSAWRAPAKPEEDNVTPNQQVISLSKRPTYTYDEAYAATSAKAAAPQPAEYETRAADTQYARKAPSAPPKSENAVYLEPNLIPLMEYETVQRPLSDATREMPKARLQTESRLDGEDFAFVGEAFSTYIIMQSGDGMWFIDKHAAHESILYDKLAAETGNMPAQLLLSPVTVSLSLKEKAACLENAELLESAGFLVEDFGSGIIVRQIPTYLDERDAGVVLSDLAGKMLEGRSDRSATLEKLLQSIACRGAIKAGDFSAPDELEAFARLVLSSDHIRNCPHGRPVAVFMAKNEIEKRFGRVL